ncbi:pilus assembly protein PilM [Planctomycetota bacterium]
MGKRNLNERIMSKLATLPGTNQLSLSLRQVAQLLEVNERTLRHWEKQGLIQGSQDEETSYRYTLLDATKIGRLTQLVSQDMPIERAVGIMRGRERTIIGVDMASYGLKIVKMLYDEFSSTLSDALLIPKSAIEDEVASCREQILSFLKANGREPEIVATLSQVFFRTVEVPTTKTAMEETKFFTNDASSHIPDNVGPVRISSFAKMGGHNNPLSAIYCATTENNISTQLDFLSQLGIKANTFIPGHSCLYLLLKDDLGSQTVSFLDMGETGARFNITNGSMHWPRIIPIGGKDFTEAIQSSLKLKNFEEAEQLKLNASQTDKKISSAIAPLLERFGDEVLNTQEYASMGPSRKTFISGGSSLLPGVQKALQDKLKCSVEVADPFSAFDVINSANNEMSSQANYLAGAVGCCLHNLNPAIKLPEFVEG